MDLQVITPVGPGHEELQYRAMQSVHIACKTAQGPFSNIRCLIIDDTKGEIGRSKARNEAVQAADSDWLFFLDADDLMHPEALRNFSKHTGRDAVWGAIFELRDGCLAERYQIPRVESLEELISYDPYITLQMGHFVRLEVAQANPFNEDMNTGEDWDYYLRLWRKYDCAKVTDPFMINVRGQHSTGPRSATGQEWMKVVHEMLEDERKSEERIKELNSTVNAV